METVPKNYMKSHALSRELCDRIVTYYKDHPGYPKDFWKKVDVRVEKNIVTGDFYVRSNMSDLLANIADLEERYT